MLEKKGKEGKRERKKETKGRIKLWRNVKGRKEERKRKRMKTWGRGRKERREGRKEGRRKGVGGGKEPLLCSFRRSHGGNTPSAANFQWRDHVPGGNEHAAPWEPGGGSSSTAQVLPSFTSPGGASPRGSRSDLSLRTSPSAPRTPDTCHFTRSTILTLTQTPKPGW